MRTSAVGLAGLTIVPSSVFGKAAGQTAPSDKLNIAAVGIGGMGAANLSNMETENIVALCDVDWQYAKGTFDRYSKAKRYWDYRKTTWARASTPCWWLPPTTPTVSSPPKP